jgi:hypothetical protein
MKYIAFILFIVTNIALGCDNVTLDVNGSKGITAKIVLKDNDSLSVSVLDGKKKLNTEDIDVSSEKKNHILLDDYNLDGYKDFSVWHLDEGMGGYKTYRMFIFSPIEKKFKEIKPTCGGDFINIRIEGDNLINMTYEDSAPKSCSIPLKTLR